jgi:hypothetical protein
MQKLWRNAPGVKLLSLAILEYRLSSITTPRLVIGPDLPVKTISLALGSRELRSLASALREGVFNGTSTNFALFEL